MATVMKCAQMADAVYDANPQVEGWQRVAFQASGGGLTNAFQGAAFRLGSEVVFAFKGTSGGRDAVADIKLCAGMNTYQYASALDFVSANVSGGGDSVSLCGHSLGGAIAQIAGNRLRLPFMTFNAPGVGLISRNLDEMAVTAATGTAVLRALGAVGSLVMHPVQAAQDGMALFYRVKGVNFRLGKDVVGCTGVHYGRVIEIPYTGGALDVLAKHKMTTVLAALKDSQFAEMSLTSLAV